MVKYDFSTRQVQQMHKLLSLLQELNEKSEGVRDTLHKLIKLHETTEFGGEKKEIMQAQLESAVNTEKVKRTIGELKELLLLKERMVGGMLNSGELKPVMKILQEKVE